MASHNTLSPPLLVLLFLSTLPLFLAAPAPTSSFFSTYIGAQFTGIKFSDVPIDENVDEFHFILSFAIDYTASSGTPTPTNGKFNVFWDSTNLSPSEVTAIKKKKDNVRVALSIGGNSVHGENVLFRPVSVDSWVRNAVSSLTRIIKTNNLDGIDIDYEHFDADPDTFAECIGQLITTLKKDGVISFASIAPFDDEQVQRRYQVLWKKYGVVIDFVNFQFYAYEKSTTVSQFLGHLDDQRANYKGGKILVSYATDGVSGGLSPETGFFNACETLQKQGKLDGIFVWSADDSQGQKFRHDKQSQVLLKMN